MQFEPGNQIFKAQLCSPAYYACIALVANVSNIHTTIQCGGKATIQPTNQNGQLFAIVRKQNNNDVFEFALCHDILNQQGEDKVYSILIHYHYH